MTRHDPHSYADLTQGRISHIDLRIQTDFETQTLKIKADYQLVEPISGSFFLDISQIDIENAHANGHRIQYEFDERDDLLGERLHLKDLQNRKLSFPFGNSEHFSFDGG